MDYVLWIAVGICLFVIVAAAAAVVAAALLGIKAAKAMKAELVGGLEQLNTATTEMEQKMAAFTARGEELQRSLDSLSESLRRVTVLVNSTRDARDLAGHVSEFVPKK